MSVISFVEAILGINKTTVATAVSTAATSAASTLSTDAKAAVTNAQAAVNNSSFGTTLENMVSEIFATGQSVEEKIEGVITTGATLLVSLVNEAAGKDESIGSIVEADVKDLVSATVSGFVTAFQAPIAALTSVVKAL